jgi:uncharacterized protein YkwD
MARTRTHVLTSALIIVILAATAGFAVVRGATERASSLPSPPATREFRRVSPLPLTPPTTRPAPPPPPPPAPVAPPPAAPEPAVAEARAPEPGPEPAPVAATVLSGAAGQLVAMINALRAGLGLPAYVVDGELTGSAQRWAQSMAASGTMSHQGDLSGGISSPWVRLGENVGVGSSVGEVHSALVGSSGHYANMADSGFTHGGVGVVESGGTLYSAVEFMQL